jgi:hypothetical protein
MEQLIPHASLGADSRALFGRLSFEVGVSGGGGVSDGERKGMNIEYVAEKVADSLPFGEGPIDGEGIAETAGPEVMSRVDTLIGSPDILVDVDKDGDGRIARVIKRGRELLRGVVNKHRTKVFGGGSTMAMADLVGSGEAAGALTETFDAAISKLETNEIDFGAHTAHADEGNCGCGAIDKAPAAIRAVGTYADKIEGVFGLLKEKLGTTGALLAGKHLTSIVDNFRSYGERIEGQAYRGSDVMDQIAHEGKIIKDLEGGHVEARIVLNCVRGKTVNQGLVHEVSGGKVDVFAVDVWRLQDLAERLHPGNVADQQRAFQSMLAYTLGVAAVLTNGKLPVYIVKPVAESAPEPQPAAA